MKDIEWVTPAELFGNWGDLTERAKRFVEEEQYRKQLKMNLYGTKESRSR